MHECVPGTERVALLTDQLKRELKNQSLWVSSLHVCQNSFQENAFQKLDELLDEKLKIERKTW